MNCRQDAFDLSSVQLNKDRHTSLKIKEIV